MHESRRAAPGGCGIPVVVGHRGAAALAPENTLPGFRIALELGVRVLELDVRLTRDGIPVCFHDERLERLTGRSGRVSAWDWRSLSALAVLPGGFDGRFPEARVPALLTVLTRLPRDTRFVVELKADPERADFLVSQTLETITAARAWGRCRLISFDADLLRRVRRSAPPEGHTRRRAEMEAALHALGADREEAIDRTLPRWPSGAEIPLGVLSGGADPDAALALASELRAEALHLHHQAIEAPLVREAHARGFLLDAWTVNHTEEVRRLAALGVDEVTTDDPPIVFAALRGDARE